LALATSSPPPQKNTLNDCSRTECMSTLPFTAMFFDQPSCRASTDTSHLLSGGLVLRLLGCSLCLVSQSAGGAEDVVCWGRNDSNQAEPQITKTQWDQISGGLEHCLALDSAGQIRCWGSNSHGQCNPPTALGSARAIGAGWQHSVAATSQGRLVAWGRNDDGQSTPPTDVTTATAVAAGRKHSVALLSDGSIRLWGDNSSGQSITPPQLPAITQVACGATHTVVLTADGRVIVWGSNEQGVSGNGLSRAHRFLRDALSAEDSVDIVTIGDSNTGYSEGIPCAGWTDGLLAAMVQFGIPQYATPLQPISPPGVSFGITSWNSPMLLGQSSDLDFPAVSVSGTDFAPQSIRDSLSGSTTEGASVIRPTGVPFDFAWIPQQPHAFASSTCGTVLLTSPSFPVEGQLTFRLLHGVDPGPGPVGRFTLMWLGANGQFLCPPKTCTTNGTSAGWSASEISLPADHLRASPIRCTFGGADHGQTFAIRGPCALGLSSVYRPVRGCAVQSLNYHGGATMTQVAADICSMPQATLMTWLGELAARQRAAGGTGRVLVLLQGGINPDSGLPESWGAAVIAMKSTLQNAWLALGNSGSSIGFLVMVSHAATPDDAALTNLRDYSRNLARIEPDICSIDLSRLTDTEDCIRRGWFSPSGPVHLSGPGYVGLSKRIVGALLGEHDIRQVPIELRVLGGCTAIASGYSHALGLLQDGRVVTWGTPVCGATEVPLNAPPAYGIAAGGGHSLLRTSDGRVICWGDNQDGQAPVLADGFRARMVAAGGNHSLSIAAAPSQPPCPADLNSDGQVNPTDLTYLLAGWGSGTGDINDDGITNGLDLTALLASLGPCDG